MTTQNNALVGFTAETFIHSGCGQSQGAIDLPFSREKATDYPYIPGSSLKGAFRDYARDIWKGDKDEKTEKVKDSKEVMAMFGKSDNFGNSGAGNLLVSDLRLLLLPVRSLTGAYKWVTCPHLLERLKRDLQRAGNKSAELSTKETYELADDEASLFLEELSFKETGQTVDEQLLIILKNLSDLVEDKEKVVIISNDDFNWFAKNALSIQARNKLNEDKATVGGALWYEESLPPDTIMYCLLSNRKKDGVAVQEMLKQIKKGKYLQIGGNETVGMGWFQMQEYGGE